MRSILIDTQSQKLILFSESQEPLLTWPVSTGERGCGQLKNSFQTPLGKHVIRARIGTGVPRGGVFVARRFTGEVWNPDLAEKEPQRDWILTRILWLSGCELNRNRLGNCDTMQRYIYIHGTPDTEPMGIPKSHGCIRMRNIDIEELYDYTQPYMPVEIQ